MSGSVKIDFEDHEVSKLFDLLNKHKDEFPDLHEKVYQAMAKELFRRVNEETVL